MHGFPLRTLSLCTATFCYVKMMRTAGSPDEVSPSYASGRSLKETWSFQEPRWYLAKTCNRQIFFGLTMFFWRSWTVWFAHVLCANAILVSCIPFYLRRSSEKINSHTKFKEPRSRDAVVQQNCWLLVYWMKRHIWMLHGVSRSSDDFGDSQSFYHRLKKQCSLIFKERLKVCQEWPMLAKQDLALLLAYFTYNLSWPS